MGPNLGTNKLKPNSASKPTERSNIDDDNIEKGSDGFVGVKRNRMPERNLFSKTTVASQEPQMKMYVY